MSGVDLQLRQKATRPQLPSRVDLQPRQILDQPVPHPPRYVLSVDLQLGKIMGQAKIRMNDGITSRTRKDGRPSHESMMDLHMW